MDTMQIKSLAVETRIGVHEWEQHINQRLLIDITFFYDFRQCNDDLNNTLDYTALCETVTHYVENQSFKLIETVANHVAELIKKEFNVPEVTVSVSKGQVIKNVGDVQVTVTR